MNSVTRVEQRSLLLVGADSALNHQISLAASRAGWRVICTDRAAAISRKSEEDSEDCRAAILVQSGSENDGLDLIRSLKNSRPALPIVVLSASRTPNSALQALQAGASEYLVKPVAADLLMQTLRKATGEEGAQELRPLWDLRAQLMKFESFVGADPRFRIALAQAAKAARGQGNILIEGEGGTGRDSLSRAIHAASPRAASLLKVVNVRSIAANSVSAVLFGQRKGAFAGAFSNKLGVLEECDGGTLVIDEINRLASDVQEQLADAIIEGRITPLGAAHSFRVSVRVIAISNRPLKDLVESGAFSAKLLKAFGGTRIELPALRNRRTDIPVLARHFLRILSQQQGLRELAITDGALSLLCSFDWPGNVRQLEAMLFRAAILCEGPALTVEDFPQLRHMIAEPNQSSAWDQSRHGGVLVYTESGTLRSLKEIETDVIRLAIGHHGGSLAKAARALGIGRSTLYRKLEQLGIELTR